MNENYVVVAFVCIYIYIYDVWWSMMLSSRTLHEHDSTTTNTTSCVYHYCCYYYYCKNVVCTTCNIGGYYFGIERTQHMLYECMQASRQQSSQYLTSVWSETDSIRGITQLFVSGKRRRSFTSSRYYRIVFCFDV